jgi:hypothetical protein
MSRSDRYLVAERLSDEIPAWFRRAAYLAAPPRHRAREPVPVTRGARDLDGHLTRIAEGSLCRLYPPLPTMSDHALRLAITLGLRALVAADLVLMIEVAAQAAWAIDG